MRSVFRLCVVMPELLIADKSPSDEHLRSHAMDFQVALGLMQGLEICANLPNRRDLPSRMLSPDDFRALDKHVAQPLIRLVFE